MGYASSAQVLSMPRALKENTNGPRNRIHCNSHPPIYCIRCAFRHHSYGRQDFASELALRRSAESRHDR